MNFYADTADVHFINTYQPLDFSELDKLNTYAGKNIEDAKKKISDFESKYTPLDSPSNVAVKKWNDEWSKVRNQLNSISSDDLRNPEVSSQIDRIVRSYDYTGQNARLASAAKMKEYQKAVDPNRTNRAMSNYISMYDEDQQGIFNENEGLAKYDQNWAAEYLKDLQPDITKWSQPVEGDDFYGTKSEERKVLGSKKISDAAISSLVNSQSNAAARVDLFDNLSKDPSLTAKYEVPEGAMPTAINATYRGKKGTVTEAVKFDNMNIYTNPLTGKRYNLSQFVYDRVNGQGQTKLQSDVKQDSTIKAVPGSKGKGPGAGSDGIDKSDADKFAIGEAFQGILRNQTMMPSSSKILNSEEYNTAMSEYKAAIANGDEASMAEAKEVLDSKKKELGEAMRSDYTGVVQMLMPEGQKFVPGAKFASEITPKYKSGLEAATKLMTVNIGDAGNLYTFAGEGKGNKTYSGEGGIEEIVFDKGQKSSSTVRSTSKTSNTATGQSQSESETGNNSGLQGVKINGQNGKFELKSVAVVDNISKLSGGGRILVGRSEPGKRSPGTDAKYYLTKLGKTGFAAEDEVYKQSSTKGIVTGFDTDGGVVVNPDANIVVERKTLAKNLKKLMLADKWPSKNINKDVDILINTAAQRGYLGKTSTGNNIYVINGVSPDGLYSDPQITQVINQAVANDRNTKGQYLQYRINTGQSEE